MSPEAAISSAVPRSGCTTIIAVGIVIMHAHHHQIPERRRQRTLVHVPGAHHRHRELHDLGGLKAQEADVEPALRAFADVAGDGDDDSSRMPTT